MFNQNGYPNAFFDKGPQKFLNPNKSNDKVNIDYVVFKVQFVGDHSFNFGKKCKCCLKMSLKKKIE